VIKFPNVADLVPEGKSGDVEVRHIEVDERAAEFSAIRAAINPGREVAVGVGTYAQLFVGRQLMMSDTEAERISNTGIVHCARGHVLIAGLGLGMIVHPIAAKREVESITIVELSPHVIKLVATTLPKKAKVVEGDIFEWKPPVGTKYDTIYFDIWPDITTDNLKDMTRLHRRYAKFAAKDAWVESWQRGHLMVVKQREARARRNNPFAGMVRCGTFRS